MPHPLFPTCPAVETPVWLFELAGPTRVFQSRRELAQWLGYAALSQGALGSALAPCGFSAQGHWDSGTHWVARQHGDLVSNADLLALLPPRPQRWRRHPAQRPSDYRRGPVPGTGVHHGYRWLRHPRTQALLREAWYTPEDHDEPRVRARLRSRPTAWDDQSRQDGKDRSWKRHRRTQWKAP